MSELKVTTLKHADSTVDSIVMASDGTLAFGAAVTDSAGVAIQGGGAAQAWVNFNGTGTVAIRRAFNVSTITDNGPGDYTVNFTTAMVDANYAITGATGTNSNGKPPATFNINRVRSSGNHVDSTTSAVRISVDPGSDGDSAYVSVAIFS